MKNVKKIDKKIINGVRYSLVEEFDIDNKFVIYMADNNQLHTTTVAYKKLAAFNTKKDAVKYLNNIK